mmetsp:Transcript_17471/g.42908  ORF Transcript_17471/g.42908 Transcript_17471/m.42908 type:complete len:604 (+) Transcript_17471:103-1914(+)
MRLLRDTRGSSFPVFLLSLLFIIHSVHSFVLPASQQYKIQPLSSSSLSASSSTKQYDLAVIGGGVVGVQAALAAASGPYSKRVCLVDAPRESGVLMTDDEQDLSLGAPTGLFGKALRDTSKRIKVSTLRGMGLREDSIWNEILSSCFDLASANADDIRRQLEDANVDLIEGLAAFADDGDTSSFFCSKPNDFSVETISAHNILIATGSTPYRQGGVPFDSKRIFDSDSINQLGYLPKSIAITGSGIIAVEYAKIFRNLGADVSLIIRDQVPRNALMKIGLDKDIAATLVADMVRSGIKIERASQVGRFDVPTTSAQAPMTIQLEAKGGGPRPPGQTTEIKAHAYLAAVGRKPNTAKLNLASVGIELDDYGGIIVDSSLCTSAKSGNVYAAGDVVGRPFLASTGTAQGVAAVAAMFGSPAAEREGTTYDTQCDADDPTCNQDGASQAGVCFDPASLASNPFAVPCGIWSSPEAAYFGLSVQQAKESGIDAGEGIALYAECLRGRVFSPNGLLKLVFEKPAGRILGVHIVGDDACELIHYGMELVNGKRTLLDLTSRLFAAVTFHEMYRLAAEDGMDPKLGRKRRAAAGRALAKRNRKTQQKENF